MTKIQLKRNFPEALSTVDEYQGEDTLTIYTEKTTQLKPWIKILQENKQIKKLCISWNISQDFFEAICELENLEELYLRRCSSIKNIDSIVNLLKLNFLYLGDPTKIESIEPLSQLINLNNLRIENAKKISHFDALSNLTKLQVLQIDGSMWTAQPIDNFEFVSKLINIRYLTFVNSKARIKNFDPLLNLKKLSVFHCSYNYPLEEFHKLHSLNIVAGNSHCLKGGYISGMSYDEIVDFFENEN